MKKFYGYALLLMSLFVFSACPSDNDDDDDNTTTKVDKSAQPFVGYWRMNFNYAMVLYSEGIMCGDYSKETRCLGVKAYNWAYNSDTSILSTSNEDAMQWSVTMINDDNWTGIPLWDLKNITSCVAQREITANTLALLMTREIWQLSGNDKFWFRDIYSDMSIYYRRNENVQSVFYVKTVKEETNKIVLSGSLQPNDIQKHYVAGTIELLNPYSYYNRKIKIHYTDYEEHNYELSPVPNS